MESLLDENSHEMYSGAASEVIPSSISSFHYAHHFGNRRDLSVSRDTLPLLAAQLNDENDFDMRLVRLGASNVSSETHTHFKFFLPDEIEMAPGGSTLENPDDPVDYNTNWDYLVDKFEEETPLVVENGLKMGSLSFYAQPGARNDTNSSYGLINLNLEDRYRGRRDSIDSGRTDSVLDNKSQRSQAAADELRDFPAVATHQRYYLAEEDLVIGVAGYTTSTWKLAVYYVLCVATLGLAYLALRWMPRYRINLMGNRAPLGIADWCVIENQFGELSIVNITKRDLNERLSSFLSVADVPDDITDDEAGLSTQLDRLLLEDEKDSNPTVALLRLFEYRYIKFFYSPVEDIFKTNSNWYDLHWLNSRTLKDGILQLLQEQRLSIFAANSIAIEEKSVGQLLMDEVLHPFYVFQIFSIFLWLADDYYYYASCIFLISMVSIVNTLIETKATIRRLKEISRFECDVRVWRNEFWKQISSTELVPGDVFEIDPSLAVVPADALLVNGECVINESMLTGESVPVSKVSADQETVKYLKENFTSPILAKSFLYNGTKILKMKTSNDEPVLAMVVKTGFNTTKGALVRSMLFPKPTGFKFYEDSFKYIGFMTVIAAIGFTYSTYNFIQLGISRSVMILRALDIITIVVPPALPATLTIGTTFAINRLKKLQIFCIAPTRVNIGGKLDVFCFDKTGTLTEDGLDVLGIHVANNAPGRKEIVFEDLMNDIGALKKRKSSGSSHETNNNEFLRAAMASCHSLRLIENELLGDPLDMKMFEFTKWQFLEEYNGRPYPLVYPSASLEHEGYSVLKEFDFISSLRRMSVVVRTEESQKQLVFTKGAPEIMLDICEQSTLPHNYEELLHNYTHRGYRVIACAYKTIDEDANTSNREFVESGLTFAGFIVFENKLKPSTKPTLQELNKAKIRTIMCTGDNVLTAISVARECHLIEPHIKHIYVPRYSEDEGEATGGTKLVWEDFNDSRLRLDSVTLKPIDDSISNFAEYRLAITGDVFRYILLELQNVLLIQSVLMHGDIFARMSPDEKHELVEQLQKIDYTVGFCGDGANDCGALKAADVGISLSEAEASVAAPFTSRVFEISCVLSVIKEGRSSLVTSFSCFKYMSLYSAIQFITVTMLYKTGTNLGDFQFLYIDLFLILPLAIFMSWSKPYMAIVAKRPTANLVSPKILIPMVCHIVLLFIFQILLWYYVQGQPWSIKPVPGGDDAVESSDNTMLFLFSNFQYIWIAVVLSKGAPYRAEIWDNVPFLVNLVVANLISLLLFLPDASSWFGKFMQLTDMSRDAYWLIVFGAAANFVGMSIGEAKYFPKLAGLYKRVFQRHTIGRSKKLFKNLNREFSQMHV